MVHFNMYTQFSVPEMLQLKRTHILVPVSCDSPVCPAGLTLSFTQISLTSNTYAQRERAGMNTGDMTILFTKNQTFGHEK